LAIRKFVNIILLSNLHKEKINFTKTIAVELE